MSASLGCQNTLSTHLKIRNSEVVDGHIPTGNMDVVGGKKRSIPLTLNYDSLRNRTLDFIPSSSSTSYCESLGHPPTHLMSFSERLPLVGRLSQMMMSIHISSMNVDIYHSGLLVRLSFIAQPKKPNDRHPKETEGKKVVGLTDCPNDAHSQLRPEREKGISPVTFVKSISGVRM